MANGYLPPNLNPVYGKSLDALLYCKTNIAGYFFDGFLTVDHQIDVTMTENPVESGSSVVDHAYIKPRQLTMQIIVSDVHRSLYQEQFDGGVYRHTKAWDILKKLQSDRIPFSVFTKLGTYDNMLIKSLSATDNVETYRALRATVELQEIPVARVKTVKISSYPNSTNKTTLGKVEAQPLTETERTSILQQTGGLASFWGSIIGLN